MNDYNNKHPIIRLDNGWTTITVSRVRNWRFRHFRNYCQLTCLGLLNIGMLHTNKRTSLNICTKLLSILLIIWPDQAGAYLPTQAKCKGNGGKYRHQVTINLCSNSRIQRTTVQFALQRHFQNPCSVQQCHSTTLRMLTTIMDEQGLGIGFIFLYE